MYGSRRYWTTVILALALASAAVVLVAPPLLVGAAGIGAWLLATQLVTVRAFQRAQQLDVTYAADARRVAVEQPVRFRLTVERDTPASTTIEVTAPVPLAAQGATREERTVTLAAGETRTATTFECAFPVAGRFDIDAPTAQLTDSLGLYSETLTIGESPTVEATPHGPADIHIGRGGDRVVAAYGEHDTDQRGAGLQPEELREYVAGDPADSIDWKATARLNQPYVREFEAETDRETILVVDHRATMETGRGGETMLAYAREVALGIAEAAADASDPLGLYTVGDEGLTTRQRPQTSPDAYDSVRDNLRDLTPTDPTATTDISAQPARARRAASALAGEESPFADSVRPFLTATDAYVQRLSGDPLFGAVEAACQGATADQWTVIVTSDSNPGRVREAVRLAADRSASVLVFLTPQVLFQDAPSDLDDAYDRYVAFEDLRRELDRMPRVTAFEVGPGDRVERLLAARRAKTRPKTTGT